MKETLLDLRSLTEKGDEFDLEDCSLILIISNPALHSFFVLLTSLTTFANSGLILRGIFSPSLTA